MSADLCLRGSLILPDSVLPDAYLLIRSGKIASIQREPPPWNGPLIELKPGYVSPGFIDIHVHGGPERITWTEPRKR